MNDNGDKTEGEGVKKRAKGETKQLWKGNKANRGVRRQLDERLEQRRGAKAATERWRVREHEQRGRRGQKR